MVKKTLRVLTILIVFLLIACGDTELERDLSTAAGRLQYEGETQPSGGAFRVNQFADDLTENDLREIFELADLHTFADYEIYLRQEFEGLLDFGIVVSFTDEELIEIVNLAIEGDTEAIEMFKSIIEMFEDIARTINTYNSRYLIRVFSPEVDDMLFRLFHSRAIVEIIDLEE